MHMEDIFECHSIVDDDILSPQMSLGKMPSIIPAIDQDLKAFSIYLDVRFMNQFSVSHNISPTI